MNDDFYREHGQNHTKDVHQGHYIYVLECLRKQIKYTEIQTKSPDLHLAVEQQEANSYFSLNDVKHVSHKHWINMLVK